VQWNRGAESLSRFTEVLSGAVNHTLLSSGKYAQVRMQCALGAVSMSKPNITRHQGPAGFMPSFSTHILVAWPYICFSVLPSCAAMPPTSRAAPTVKQIIHPFPSRLQLPTPRAVCTSHAHVGRAAAAAQILRPGSAERINPCEVVDRGPG
jgi:hypothetical protein